MTQNSQPKAKILSLPAMLCYSSVSEQGEKNPQQPWGFYTVVVALLSGYFLLPLLAANIILLIQHAVTTVEQLLWQQVITYSSWVLIFTVLFFRYGALPVKQELGLIFSGKKRDLFWQSFQLLVLTSVLTIIVNIFWQFLEHGNPTWSAGASPYQQYQQSELLVLSFFAVFLAPVFEELVFRGLVQSALDRLYSPLLSVLLTCGIFLFFHSTYFGSIKAISHVLILALCLGFWREKTRSILPGMLVHLFNNILASSILLMPS